MHKCFPPDHDFQPKQDGVLGTQTSRLLLSYYNNTAIEATALFVQQRVKGAIIADLGGKMAAILDDCERTTVALPTAATSGFISGEVGISAALDAFSTVYELPLTRFKKGQTDKLDGVPRTQTSRLLLSLTTAVEATALFVQQHVKGAIIVQQ